MIAKAYRQYICTLKDSFLVNVNALCVVCVDNDVTRWQQKKTFLYDFLPMAF
jgi:hypothetical protein